jgi:hypothetical protein
MNPELAAIFEGQPKRLVMINSVLHIYLGRDLPRKCCEDSLTN